MEEQIINSFMSLGVVGVIAGVLFKIFLEEKAEEKKFFREEIKESRDLYKNELEKNREEIQKDREVYISSIDKITNRIDIIEDDVKEIKDKLNK